MKKYTDTDYAVMWFIYILMISEGKIPKDLDAYTEVEYLNRILEGIR